MIECAEISLYDENYDSISFELSPTQLKAVCKILGIKPGKTEDTITCYSDTSVQKMIEFLSRLQPIE